MYRSLACRGNAISRENNSVMHLSHRRDFPDPRDPRDRGNEKGPRQSPSVDWREPAVGDRLNRRI